MEYPKWIGSSQNPEEISLKIKGILLGLVPTINLLAPQFGIDWLALLVNAIAGVVASVWILWGVIRKYKKQ